MTNMGFGVEVKIKCGSATLYTDGYVEYIGQYDNFSGDLAEVTFLAKTGADGYAALKSDGSVVVWGDKSYGGDAGSKQKQLVDVTYIASNDRTFAALKKDGSVFFWGNETKSCMLQKVFIIHDF